MQLLDECQSPEGVRRKLLDMPPQKFLDFLAPEQWEIVCSEYLRDAIGFRFLVLKPGKTLPDVDLVGVDKDSRRILAQCKNDQRSAEDVREWLKHPAIGADDKAYYFCREGFSGTLDGCEVVNGDAIAEWLETTPDYFRALKTL